MKAIYGFFDKLVRAIKLRIEVRPIAEFQSALAFNDYYTCEFSRRLGSK
jgi:hypothetical protein